MGSREIKSVAQTMSAAPYHQKAGGISDIT